ncbi:MAG: class I SAM-dependent methyltransferase [Clostridia bacterium]|nr:class I SAM-dependent methyltransferase [Clostridia bacterium]
MINLDKVAVTTSRDREHQINTAKDISKEIGIQYIPREKMSLDSIKTKYNLSHLIIVREDKIVVDENYFFHPGMAIPRIKMLKKGEPDPMVQAMDINEGDRILDCTLGMASDAIVAGFAAGSMGKVTGIESSPIIYVITKWGLAGYQEGSKDAQKVMRNIAVINAYYEEYLQKLPENSYDIVYFDPMFEKPLIRSNGIQGLRAFANYAQINKKIIELALKVAKKRVVIKDWKHGRLFDQLSVDNIIGGKYSSIKYGFIKK